MILWQITIHLCDTTLMETWTSIYLPQIGNWWQTKVWLSPKSKLVTQWISVWLFTGMVRVTYRNRNVSKTAISLKPTVSWVTAHKIWGAQCTDSRHLNRLENIITSWPEPLPRSSAGRCLFLLGISAVPCFLWAMGLTEGDSQKSWLFLFLFSESGSHFIFCTGLECAVDQADSVFLPKAPVYCDHDHVLQCPSSPCLFVCFALRHGLAK